jgi:hypothetical protein
LISAHCTATHMVLQGEILSCASFGGFTRSIIGCVRKSFRGRLDYKNKFLFFCSLKEVWRSRDVGRARVRFVHGRCLLRRGRRGSMHTIAIGLCIHRQTRLYMHSLMQGHHHASLSPAAQSSHARYMRTSLPGRYIAACIFTLLAAK